MSTRFAKLALALGGGFLVALAMPPWGWWPLAFPGLVLLDQLIADRPAASRFRRGYGVAFTLLARKDNTAAVRGCRNRKRLKVGLHNEILAWGRGNTRRFENVTGFARFYTGPGPARQAARLVPHALG